MIFVKSNIHVAIPLNLLYPNYTIHLKFFRFRNSLCIFKPGDFEGNWTLTISPQNLQVWLVEKFILNLFHVQGFFLLHLLNKILKGI